MASADLDHIRALLIAQTAQPEPQARGLFARLRKGERREAPARERSPPEPRFRSPDLRDLDQEMLLEVLCGAPAPDDGLDIETASPLPPPSPRGEFGRRADIAAEMELMLQTPTDEPRRLRVLDASGSAIGEVILHPQEPPLRAAYTARDEPTAVPYFPEDFLEPGAPPEPQPMRPWIKALRGAGTTRPAPRPAPARQIALEPATGEPPLTKRVRARRTAKTAPPAKAPQTLGQDLLEALAITLAREHDALSDRLVAVAGEGLFRRIATDAVPIPFP